MVENLMKGFNDLHYEHFCENVSTKNTYLQPQNLPPTSAAAKQCGNWLINSQLPLMTDFLLAPTPSHNYQAFARLTSFSFRKKEQIISTCYI